MPANSERLDEGADLKWYVIREMIKGRSWDNNVVCKTTAPTRQANKAIRPTAVLQTFLACAAGVIVDDRLDDDPVSGLVVSHTITNLFHCAAELMPEGKWNRFTGDWMGRSRAEIRAT
jgi:hypothetical protein